MNSDWSYCPEMLHLGKNYICCLVWPSNLTDDLEGKEHLFYSTSSFVHHIIPISELKLELQSGNNLGRKCQFCVPCDLKSNGPPLLCYFKLCASFHSHMSFQTGVTVRKRPIRVKIDDFFPVWPRKFDGWPWKTIGLLFYATSSFVHHFFAICEFKLELWSRNC